MFLNCRNVFTKNYKWSVSYIMLMFIFRGKLYSFRVPYFIKKGLTQGQIDAINEVMDKIERLK